MLINYLKIAWRSLLKDKFYSLINILGLTIGVTCGILLMLYVADELSYDRHHANANRVHRIVSYITEPDHINRWTSSQPPLGPHLRANYSFVENYVRFFPQGRVVVRQGAQRIPVDDVYAADSTVFDLFSHRFLAGEPANALVRPNSVVLTEPIAKQLFGPKSALGQSVRVSETAYTVTGVVEDVPRNSHLRFSALLSLSQAQKARTEWGDFTPITYLLLPENMDLTRLTREFPKLYEEKMAGFFRRMGITITYELQPLTSIHLYSRYDGESNGNISYVYTFAAIAFFMLLLASINYMNLATARSAKRAREVGMRKAVGSTRQMLVVQFLTESVLITVMALGASALAVAALLPFFNEVSGKAIQQTQLVRPQFLGLALVIVVVTGLVSGSYPAFYLSRFNPAVVLKGSFKTRGGDGFRKALVVAQFSISLIMLICTWVVYRQLDYLRTKDLGYSHEQVLTLDYQDELPLSAYQAFRASLLKNPSVGHVATASQGAGGIGGRVLFTVEGQTGLKEMAFMPLSVDHTFLPTLGINLTVGRNFSTAFPADTLNSVIVNEAAVKRMGWKQPLGQKIRLGNLPGPGQPIPPTAQVVGVVKDFHQQSLYSAIEPMVMTYDPINPVIHIKLKTADIPATIAFLEKQWQASFPDRLFSYAFLDQNFDSVYHADQLRGRIFSVFSALTMLIACLGLFGLATFTAEQRIKEIGVRKVLGASVTNVVLLLSKDFTRLVLFSFPIAIPIAWYSMSRWLESFPYKRDIEPWIFAVACALTLLICWLTVLYQSLKAALTNPVKSLRSE